MAQVNNSTISWCRNSKRIQSFSSISNPERKSRRRPGAAMPFDHSETTEAQAGAGETKRRKQHSTQAGSPTPDIKSRARTAPFSNVHSLLSLTALLVTLTLLCGTAAAQQAQDRHPRSPSIAINELDPAWRGPSLLLVDKNPAPSPPPPLMYLLRRADGTSSAASPSKTLATAPKTSTSEFPIPRPFDTSALGNNFTAPCSVWFKKFLSNDMMNACHPFSLLLQTSSSFFDASKSFARITNTLEATCNVNTTICLPVMQDFAQQIRDESNCAVDYANDNPSVVQAYNGLIAYQPLYQASCLRDSGGSYCFANAITNASAVTDSYPYYLPLGVTLPGGARPTCSTCLQDTMAIFSSFAGNTTQPISRTYSDAAQHIDMICGPTFVNKTATPLKAGAPSGRAADMPVTGTVTLLTMLVLYYLG